jgi:hypothetical protein
MLEEEEMELLLISLIKLLEEVNQMVEMEALEETLLSKHIKLFTIFHI